MERVLVIVRENRQVDGTFVDAGCVLGNARSDRLDRFDLMMAQESALGLAIPDAVIVRLDTVNDHLRLVDSGEGLVGPELRHLESFPYRRRI